MKDIQPNDGKLRKCSICGKQETERFRPFCSKHCADVDLSRWLKGVYAIPADEKVRDATEEDQ